MRRRTVHAGAVPAEGAVLGETMIPAGTVLLLPVRVVYEVEQTEGAFVCVEAIEGGRRMLVRLADLKATEERPDAAG